MHAQHPPTKESCQAGWVAILSPLGRVWRYVLVVLVRPFSSPAAAWVVLCLGLATTAAGTLMSRQQVKQRQGERFGVLVETLRMSLVERLGRYEQVLLGVAGQ